VPFSDLISVLSPWFWVVVVFLVVDALKVYVEIWNRPRGREYASDLSEVTALIATYDGEQVIRETVQSLIDLGLPREQILVIDDGSQDRTAEILAQLGVRVYTVPNMGKVSAINFGIHRVKTKYVLLLDDDTRVGQARLPTGLLEHHDAVAFNVIPDRRDRYGPAGSNLVSCLQRYEYCKSMEIGRRFQDKTASIACVSGAIGLFKRERLQKYHHEHTGAFEGEDLERTLIEHLFHGEVVFADEVVWTVVPDSAPSLLRQRLVYWYPAHYHMFWNYWRLLLARQSKLRLRYECAYNIFVVLAEPWRVASLAALLWYGRWLDLAVLYSLYFLLELYPFSVIQRKFNTGHRLLVLFGYPLYGLANMLLRVGAFPVWIWKRFVKKSMKPKTAEDRKWWIAPEA
jgi:cellulose synthase/poly-beta-1,6-N-acetylglucosamine synthase-like glycosyltransferase